PPRSTLFLFRRQRQMFIRDMNNVTDSEAFPGLIRQTHRKIRAASADGAYDTRLCHDELRRKKISALIPPRKGAG
ncbi:transposase, partial [Klebsiella pneumoniae]